MSTVATTASPKTAISGPGDATDSLTRPRPWMCGREYDEVCGGNFGLSCADRYPLTV